MDMAGDGLQHCRVGIRCLCCLMRFKVACTKAACRHRVPSGAAQVCICNQSVLAAALRCRWTSPRGPQHPASSCATAAGRPGRGPRCPTAPAWWACDAHGGGARKLKAVVGRLLCAAEQAAAAEAAAAAAAVAGLRLESGKLGAWHAHAHAHTSPSMHQSHQRQPMHQTHHHHQPAHLFSSGLSGTGEAASSSS